MRLDRYLSLATALSRAASRRAVRGGAVTVDGTLILDPACAVADTAAVHLSGSRVELPVHRYLMLHKPSGYVCGRRDRRYPSVFELVAESMRQNLHVAGRLDVDTTGLVLLTDDGVWSHALTAPRRKQPKTYLASLAAPLGAHAAAALRSGVALRDDPRPTRPASLEVLSPRQVRVTVTEGRYHQVKRMFAAVGNRVVALHRERIGPLDLDPALAPGQHRALTAAEVAAVGPGSGQLHTPGRKL